MIDRFAQLPRSLMEKTRFVRLGPSQVPALLAHPDWERPAPVMMWMHGRTVNKELDSGRYQRWLRAGIAACALDLPGHGERMVEGWDRPAQTLRVVSQMVGEIDGILEALADPVWSDAFDLDRMGIGGMSAGGMAALRRLCDPHPFACCAVEATTGWLERLYGECSPWGVAHDADAVRAMDAMGRLDRWRPIPLLALHARHDEVVPLELQAEFIERVRARTTDAGGDSSSVELVAFDRTDAQREHAGFGRFGAEAKSLQTEFLIRHLKPEANGGAGGEAQLGG